MAQAVGISELPRTPAKPLEQLRCRLAGSTRVCAARWQRRSAPIKSATPSSSAPRTRAARAFTISSICVGPIEAAPDAVVYQVAATTWCVCCNGGEHGVGYRPVRRRIKRVGGVTAARGSQRACVALDLTEMRKMIAVDPVSMTATPRPVFTAAISKPLERRWLHARSFSAVL